MSFTSGFIGGLAKSIDERLKDGMRRTEERADRILERTSIRAEREQQRAEEEQREVADLLSEFASLIDESQVPEGMTLMDYAAGLYRRGGGTISGAKSYLEDLRAHEKGGGSVSSLVDYASLKTGGYGEADYVKKFVRQPDTLVKVPKGMRGGAGLYGKLFDVDVTEGLQDEIFATYGKPEETPDFQMGQLGFREGAQLLPTADIIQKRKLAEVQLQLAQEKLAGTITDNKLKGAIDVTQVNRDYNGVLKAHLNKAGIAVTLENGNLTFDVKTAVDKAKDVQTAYATSLKNVTENAIGSLNVPGMKETLKSLATGSMSYVTPTWSRPENMVVGQIYYTGKNTKNPNSAILFTGDLSTSIEVKKF